MSEFSIQTPSEQVAGHLRGEILRGRWSGTMPGVPALAAGMAVDPKTVAAALGLLEREGLLVGQGLGRPRRIVLPKDHEPCALRVGLLPFDSAGRGESLMIDLHRLLEKAGHVPLFPDRSLLDLGMDPVRVARMVRRTAADAWVVTSAPREVLEWFAGQETPAFALAGRYSGLPLAGTKPDKVSPLVAASHRLIALGHRRISFLCRRHLRLPQPTRSIRSFLAALEAAGIGTGSFHLPDWEETHDGFGRILKSLFEHTAPTALILDEAHLYHAGYHQVTRGGLRIPEDVSLVCTDGDPTFAWCQPSVAHIAWDNRPVVSRIVRWASNVARGKDDREQGFTKAEFVEGGTVGIAPQSPRRWAEWR